jgi:hypothetical protein
VLVLAPNLQAFVSREVRKTSFISMVGVPHDEDHGEHQKLMLLQAEDDDDTGLHQQVKADPEDRSRAATNIKKRTLYKELSGTDVPWFPYDNAIELLKELCWEAGAPRWVIHGTPAGGAGVHACLEMGCSVLALCHDAHHRTHLERLLLERAVEAMINDTTVVFKDDALQARSVELNLTTPPNAASANKTPKPEEKDASDEQENEATPKAKKGRNKRNARATRTNKKASRRRASNDSPASDSDSESDGATPTPSAKKSKNS